MKFHEFQAKQILQKNGIKIPDNYLFKANESFDSSKIPFKFPVVVKSQILAGGRGKAGLVKLLKEQNSFTETCQWIVGQKFKEETSVGILVEDTISFTEEYYFSMLINRASKNISIVFSPCGGVDIENVSATQPEKIITLAVVFDTEKFAQNLREKTTEFFSNEKRLENFIKFAIQIRETFFEIDATLLEINPFVFNEEDELIALDGVLDIDDSAKYRQKELFAELKALTAEFSNPDENANQFGSHYVELDGDVGIIGCGAGIVMASMDMIKKFGGSPANFMDLGGGARKDITIDALALLNSSPKVKCIFVNIFGGITFCDQIAEAIIEYRAKNHDAVPMIIRMMGNNAEIAIKMLKESGIFAYNSMEQAAKKAVQQSQKQESPFFISQNSKVIVQGITGKYGAYHTKKMLEYGTKIEAGVTPGKGGETVHGLPVFNSVNDVVQKFDIDASVVFVPAPFVKAATFEAIEAGIPLIIIITEHVPVHDTLQIINFAKLHGTRIVGPNCPGMIRVNEANLGIIPGKILKKGNVAIMSKSGTLLYEISNEISNNTEGVSTAIGLGGDPIAGTSVLDTIEYLLTSKESKYIVYIGEIGGGDEEEKLAEYLRNSKLKKPVIAFFAGDSAPKGAKMGHAGAIVSGEKSTIEYKKKVLKESGCYIAELPSDIYKIINQIERK